MNQRLMVYRKVASARTRQELDTTLEGIRDRYGPPPSSVLNLAEYGRVRILADAVDVESIDREGRVVVIRFRPNARLDPMRLVKVVGGWPGAVLVPPVSVKLDVEASTTPAPPSPPQAPLAKKADRATKRGEVSTTGSWWTARATAGEVKPGFSKDQILRKPETDPRAAGGMFSRLAGLLHALGPEGQSF
jgi:TRCF domain